MLEEIFNKNAWNSFDFIRWMYSIRLVVLPWYSWNFLDTQVQQPIVGCAVSTSAQSSFVCWCGIALECKRHNQKHCIHMTLLLGADLYGRWWWRERTSRRARKSSLWNSRAWRVHSRWCFWWNSGVRHSRFVYVRHQAYRTSAASTKICRHARTAWLICLPGCNTYFARVLFQTSEMTAVQPQQI